MRHARAALFVGIMAFGGCQLVTEPAQQVAVSHGDWAGTYEGTLPCADCGGIENRLTLTAEGSYRLVETYLGGPANPDGSSYTYDGKFHWTESGTDIILDGPERDTRYRLQGLLLVEVDLDGRPLTGPLAGMYNLKKVR